MELTAVAVGQGQRKYKDMPTAYLRERIGSYSKATAEVRKGGRSDLVAVGHDEINAMLAELEARGELDPKGC